MFSPRHERKFRDTLDGLSNTIVAGEMITDLGDRDKRSMPVGGASRGFSIGFASAKLECRPGLDPERTQFWADPLPSGISQITNRTTRAEEARGYKWAS